MIIVFHSEQQKKADLFVCVVSGPKMEPYSPYASKFVSHQATIMWSRRLDFVGYMGRGGDGGRCSTSFAAFPVRKSLPAQHEPLKKGLGIVLSLLAAIASVRCVSLS